MRFTLALWLTACGSGGGGSDLATADLTAGPRDFGIDLGAMSPIGGPCVTNADCVEGLSPVCFRHTLFNKSGFLATPGGLCSSKCTTDFDCGPSGVCVDESSS